MKKFIIASLIAVTSTFAHANQEYCGAVAGLTESVYVARYQGVNEVELVYNLIEATEEGELNNLKIAVVAVKEVYSMPRSKVYRGGESQLGSAVFEICLQNSAI